MLTEFTVKNYKCLADVSLPLTPIHVLIGQNDTGKTSLFEAIKTGCILASRFRDETPPHDFFYGNGNGDVLRPILTGEWEAPDLLWNPADQRITYSMRFTETKREQAGSNTFEMDLSLRNGAKSSIHSNSKHVEKDARIDVIQFQPAMMSRPSVLHTKPKLSLYEDGFGLPTLLSEINDYHYQRFNELQSRFKHYFPNYLLIRLENTNGWERINQNDVEIDKPTTRVGKRIILVTRDREIRLEQSSDGAKILLGILSLIYSPKPPSILLIEEPENGIHPKRLHEIVKILKDFVSTAPAAPQIIMTTHSPYLLSEFQPEEVTLMRRQPDGSAQAFPLRKAKHIHERMGNEFYLGELWYNLDEEELLK